MRNEKHLGQKITRGGIVPTVAGRALLDTFERIRIINLKKRADRRRDITKEFARLGLEIDGERIAFHEAYRPEEAGKFPSIGARGAFVSHCEVLNDARLSGAQNVLILEDDCDFAVDIEARLPAAMEALRAQPWGIFYGGVERKFDTIHGHEPLEPAFPNMPVMLAHFIAFSREALEIGVPYLSYLQSRPAGSPEGGPMHVDGAYSWLRKDHPELLTLMANPMLGHQRSSRTDIHRLGIMDRTPALRELMSIARRVKRQMARAAG
jgi:hypothetical protein